MTLQKISLQCIVKQYNLVGIYLFKVNDENTRTMCKICFDLTIQTQEQRQWRHSGIFIFNSEKISNNTFVFPLMNLNK